MEQQCAWLDDKNLITLNTPITPEHQKIWLKSSSQQWVGHVSLNDGTTKIHFSDSLPVGEELYIEWEMKNIPVYPRKIVQTKWFQSTFHAHDDVLGASYTPDETSFAVWSPLATEIKLCLNENVYTMKKNPFGVWKTIIEGDWHHAIYQYEVTVCGKTQRVNDPYAKGLTSNSIYSVVINLENTDPLNFRAISRPSIPVEDSIIYELHVRDATISPSSGVNNKGRFKGLTEKGTKTAKDQETALDYIRNLGITHVQLLPINDFDNVDELAPQKNYNWGYDPLFYQVPEGSYATNPVNPSLRILECKEMIQSFHQEGIGVILDVVYNHVFKLETSPFEVLVPGYYFRFHEDGMPSNGSGVGNDIASERPMVRKFILDTIDFWLREYKVDGFRFDLMGIIDIETMKEIRERCDQEDSPIFLLGEGWDLPTILPHDKKATIHQSKNLPRIGFFNDRYRDILRGNNFHIHDVGFANGNGKFRESMLELVSGSCMNFANPQQSINYVECHDNHTLWDRLLVSHESASDIYKKRIHQLATGIVLLSQGIPFLHAGQEWFRTKYGDENSYCSGDTINQLNWEQLDDNLQAVKFIKNCISLRKSSKLFRMTSNAAIKKHVHEIIAPHPVFGYTLLGDNADFVIFINPSEESFDVQLPSPARWEIVLSNYSKRGENPHNNFVGDLTSISGYELIVFKKER